MKTTLQFDDKLLDNNDKFQDDFYKRFKLRHAPKPLQLTDTISKNYLFPTFYSDVTCAIAIFLCSYDRAKDVVSREFGPKVKPVKMTKGRSLVAFSCYEYRNVMGVPPYNEIAMTIPIMFDAAINIPVLPMVLSSFKKFGYYIFGMPVTSKENQIRGNKIWGLPKVTQEIDITEKDGYCKTVAKEENGQSYLEIDVPMNGTPTDFDVKSNLYSKLGDEIFQSETNFKATFNVTKHMNLLFKKGLKPDRQYIKIGNTESAKTLNELQLEEHPFQFRFAKHMSSCFDLPNPSFKSSIKPA